ncbi:MAG: site-specific DNA-methyltransferase [Burkholderiales bacterium]|nr:site-specific DNA-methyltransferase [Burkholderiales bacterium]
MTLKRQILVQMTREQLKAAVDALGLTEVDRRSAEAMRAKLSRAHRATAAALLEPLSEAEVKAVCDAIGVTSVGRRSALIERLLESETSGFALESEQVPEAPEIPTAARSKTPRAARGEKKVTRYTYDDIREPGTPETGHTPLLPADEQVVTLPMDNGWSKALHVGKLPQAEPGHERPVVVDMDPAADPVLFWAGKRNRREVPVLPLQRNEIVSESRIAQIIERARRAAEEKSGQARQGHLFADLEKTLRESDKGKRVEFYTHEEGWKNKLICGDSLHVMESLLHYENLRGKVQMIYIDPPYGIAYNTNIQQRVDSIQNVRLATGGKKAGEQVKVSETSSALTGNEDVLSIKAFRDTWTLGIHSYLGHLCDRLYLARDLLSSTGSIFLQISDANLHYVRVLMDEVFGASNFIALITFRKKMMPLGAEYLEGVSDYLIWYARDKSQVRAYPIYRDKIAEGDKQWSWVETPDGCRRKLTAHEIEDHAALPKGSRVFQPISLLPADYRPNQDFAFTYKGQRYSPPRASAGWQCWKTDLDGMTRLAELGRLHVPAGGEDSTLRYVYYLADYPVSAITNLWSDTKGADNKQYVVQTSETVVTRCLHLATEPGDVVLDITCGSGTTAYSAERWGRRWITCDTSRVAINVARKRLLSAVFEHWACVVAERPGSGFRYKRAAHITMESLTKRLEDPGVALRDQPERDSAAVRVTGPVEVLTLGRYSIEDWKGYVVREPGPGEAAKLENYIETICRLYRKNAAIQGASGLVHAVAESAADKIAISVGPLTGRVTAKQISDAVQDALASGILEVHVLGWAFEANVGEVKSALEKRGKVKVELIMIRPDTLAEGLKATQPEMLFSPLALPDIAVDVSAHGKGEREIRVTLKGVALFDRKRRSTEYKAADSGYVSAWYLDEDYDGDCFVDCQMFFDFKKTPNIKAALKAEVDPGEFTLKLESEPFPLRGYKRIAVKVVDVYGNESTMVREFG